MRTSRILIPLILMIFSAVSTTSVYAQGGDWKRLGDKDVSHTLDHDTIDTNEKGRVREIRLSVTKAPIRFSKIVINYEDGGKQEVDFVENLAMDQNSRTVAISGDGNVIKSIDVWYETASLGGRQAKVVAWGRNSVGTPNVAPVVATTSTVSTVVAADSGVGWRKLGDENVNFDVDHDTIDIEDDKRIKELRVRVTESPVKFRKIVITYKDGQKQDVDFIEDLAMGRDSRTIAIEGDGRVIDSVEFWYETGTMAGKKANIALYGRS
jgi:hypothetical protein